MILPQEREALNNFSDHPIGTGPYTVMHNTNNQLKIHTSDDYFDYRALIGGINVWVLSDTGEEPGDGLTLKGPTRNEKAIESRPEEDCYYLMFNTRSHHGASREARERASRVLSPINLVYHADEQYQRLWLPAYGLLPRWHHARPGHDEKPAGPGTLTIACYRNHTEHRTIAQTVKTLLTRHQVQLNIQGIDYDQ